MKIGILGLGYVGSAVAWAHRHHIVIKRDPKLEKDSASIDEIKTCDAVYVCVPTPMREDGHCDDSYLESVLLELNDYNKVIICKSTIPPGVYKELQDIYSNIVHAPEFLTAANATQDYEMSNWCLVGGSGHWIDDAIEIIKSSTISAIHYHKTDIATASLFKYIANSLMASKVIFMNDMYHLATCLGIDWGGIKSIAVNDSRLGNSHWDVPGPDGKFGFGGACFPKDVSAIIEHAKDQDLRLELLESVQALNKKHRN
jgi:nucleotide sugar dehydrogenase